MEIYRYTQTHRFYLKRSVRHLFIIFPEEECNIRTRTKQNIQKRKVYLKGVCIFLKKSIFVQWLGLHE